MGPYSHRRMERTAETTVYERTASRGPITSSSERFSEVEGRDYADYDLVELQSGGVLQFGIGEGYCYFSDEDNYY